MPSNVKKLVFMGDSISDCARARPVGEGLFGAVGNGFIHLVDAMVKSQRPQWNLRVVNMGIDGNTSADLLARWDTDVLCQKPDIVAVLVGINDVWRQFDSPLQTELQVTPEAYRQNLCAMVEKTLPSTKQMLFLSPFFLEPNAEEPMRAQMDCYGAIMREVAQKYQMPFVDLQTAFAPLLQAYHPAFIAWDRVHPNPTGQMVIANAVWDALAAML